MRKRMIESGALGVALAALAVLPSTAAERKGYEANWASLDARPTPAWWTDAKFGIFIHWGLYSVPAFAPTSAEIVYECYAEWYRHKMMEKKPFRDHHAQHYGKAPYANFGAQFTARFFEPEKWADLFRRAGAKYVVLTSKHHDGYALWPSAQSPYYNSVALGPGRDLAGDLTKAVKAAGLKSGFYYSLMEYVNPLYLQAEKDGTVAEWSRTMNLPQLKELVEKYRADIIWTDGEWGHSDAEWLSCEYLQWLFNESSMRESVVVNDRWGKKLRGKHGGHYTTEYGYGDSETGEAAAATVHPWEECHGLGHSFGFNRFETTAHYMTAGACVELLVDTVARGGNLLLDIGPDADGLIPVIMEDRLLAMGRWLAVNGEAIYGTRVWPGRPADMKKTRVYYTAKERNLYAIVFAKAGEVVVPVDGVRGVTLLGSDRTVAWSETAGRLTVKVPEFRLGEVPCEHALVFRIER